MLLCAAWEASGSAKLKMTFMSSYPKAIFFDVGNTLLFPNRERILAPLHKRGLAPSSEQLLALERKTKKEFDTLLEHDGKPDHGFWYLFYSHLFEELGFNDDVLRDKLVAATRVSANWCDIRPRTREILQSIASDHRIGVISNADGKIADVLAHCGIADCFRTITDSGVVGFEKPHAAIFQAAVHDMGAAAEESLYVGDVYSVDYLGATRAGMRAILFDVAGAYRDDGLPRVESLGELETKLRSGSIR
jgi:HAD superfamily hydrolase (TIGR01509 family)